MFTLDLTDNKDASTDEPAAENNTTEWNFQPPVNETNEEEQPVNKTWLDDESTPEKEVRSFNLESSAEQPAKSEDGKIRYMLDEEDEKEASKENDWTVSNKSENETQPSVEDNADLARMRQERIRQTGSKMKSAEGLNELEKEPAYLRRNIRLEDVPHSSETQRSRFTLGENKEGEDGKTGLSGNNSFLHDNVD